MTPPHDFRRRKEDDFMFKVKQWGAVASALAALGVAFFWLGSTKWVSKEECQNKFDENKAYHAESDKTQALLRNDLNYIKQAVDDINRKLDR